MRTTYISLASLALAWILPVIKAPAATFTNFYIFSADAFTSGANAQATNGDGVGPSGFVVSGNTIYGTAYNGGTFGYGTLYRVDTDGQHFTNFQSFNLGVYDAASNSYQASTGDYVNPGLLLISNTLYGTTFYGGTYDAGTVFKINTDGSGFDVIHSFNFNDGQSPSSGLTRYGNELYGTTAAGGTNGSGTLFGISLGNLPPVHERRKFHQPGRAVRRSRGHQQRLFYWVWTLWRNFIKWRTSMSPGCPRRLFDPF